MKKNFIFTRVLAAILALICTLSMALAIVSCSDDGDANESSTPVESPAASEEANISITLEVVGPDGTSKEFAISTDPKNNLRQALEAEGLIAGDESEFGLYVKVVNGITADYDVDGSWWGLYKDGEMLMTGVDSTPIADGDHFEFIYSK